MERLVVGFVRLLRRAGLRVSPGETLDAVQALAATGLADRARARAALRLTLVKSEAELGRFDALFDGYFGEATPARGPGALPADAAAVAAEGRWRPAAQGDEGERSGAKLLVETGEEDGLELDLDTLTPVEGDSEGGARMAVQSRRFRGGRADKPRPIHHTRGPIYLRTDDDFLSRWRNEGVKPFPPEEEAAMEEVVARMVKRLRKDARDLRSDEKRGRLAVVKTLQRNYRHGLVPFVRVLRRQRKERPRLVVLCDVSYSVSHASRFLLLLVHTLQQGLLDVRSFVFNRQIAEVTDLLRSLPINATLERIEGGGAVSLEDDSDFGSAFLAFQASHLPSLRGRPAVVILGDARNNYNPAHEEVLAAIRERASTVLWLTPEDRGSWELGDCLMNTYGPLCDRVEVVRNVEELSRVVEELVRGGGVGGGAERERERPRAPAAAARRPGWTHGGQRVET
ncbi:MAG: VWA domain-containing protein [Deltaproteobacteria bacterium]|nr:VWA domain-containing protein [Deltaproteobacteria bacterium]